MRAKEVNTRLPKKRVCVHQQHKCVVEGGVQKQNECVCVRAKQEQEQKISVCKKKGECVNGQCVCVRANERKNLRECE